MAVFDDNKTMIGSCNFSNAGLTVNHEADAEVISEAVGKSFTKMFDDHWKSRSLEKPFT
jgi:phosphatidylserine/phosphatidylglycerophosphate/cardiolipin synthase-like enzyme